MASADKACVVLCTVPSEEVGVNIARTLLDERLVACVNIVPGVRSLYRYQGKLEDERELLLVLKTRRALYARLEARVRELHPYEVCEVLLLEVGAGAAPYLAWIAGETTGE
jgi:periplasmic divalent cation tolerance protein